MILFMLKRNIIFLCAVVAVAGSMNAQVRPGLKMGYNLGGVMADYRGNYVPKPATADDPGMTLEEALKKRKVTAGDPRNFHMKSGFQAGLIADCPINDAFAIQPGARFAMQGFTDKYTSNGDVIRNFSLFFLQIPVNAQYKVNIAEETHLLFQAGPYAGFGLFGRQSFNRKGKSQELSDNQKKITFGDGKDIQNVFDYGIGAGVGIELYRFQLIVNYDYGLNQSTFYKKDAKSATYHVDMRNHNFSVTLGVIFGRRDPLQRQKD